MKLTYLAFVFLLSFLMCGNSQTNVNNTAFKFDGLEYKDFDEATKARLKSYGDEVKKRKAKGYVIGYSGSLYKYGQLSAKQIAFYTAWDAVGYDIYSMREKGQLLLVDGGYRQKPFVELFIVPKDAPPPKPTPTLQKNDIAFCPSVTVSSPLLIWRTDKPITFSASVREEETGITPSFKWTVSDGEIIDGQGTKEIAVRLSTLTYKPITATVEVEGYSAKCKTKVSETSAERLTEIPVKFDEFQDINCEEEWARLDNLAVHIQSDAELQVNIIFYGGEFYNLYNVRKQRHEKLRARRGEAEARAARLKSYLINSRGTDPERVRIINGGFRREWAAEIYIVPQSGKSPVPTPTLTPDKIIFRKGRVKEGEHGCGDLG